MLTAPTQRSPQFGSLPFSVPPTKVLQVELNCSRGARHRKTAELCKGLSLAAAEGSAQNKLFRPHEICKTLLDLYKFHEIFFGYPKNPELLESIVLTWMLSVELLMTKGVGKQRGEACCLFKLCR